MPLAIALRTNVSWFRASIPSKEASRESKNFREKLCAVSRGIILFATASLGKFHT
jgi:hypothetical protein